MPIDVICPKCHSKLRAPDEVVGKSVRCKKCQEKFKVPNPGAPVDSVGDTQMLSVVEVPKPAAVPASAHVEATPLDDSAFDEPLPAVVKAAVAPLPSEVDDDRPKKKRPRDDDDDDRPKKKKKPKEKPLIGGEPAFAMPGASEDAAPIHVSPTPHASQFTFGAPVPIEADDDDEEDRPKSKKKRPRADDEDDEDDRPKKKGTAKPAKSKKMLYILGGLALAFFLGCGGAAAGVYFLVLKPAADAISKATVTVGTIPTKKDEPEKTVPTRPTKPGGGTEPTKPPPKPVGPVVTPFTLPADRPGTGVVVSPGILTPLPFSPDALRQIHGFDHPNHGPMLLAIYQSQAGFNGRGSEDTLVRFDLDRKTAMEFTAPADRIAGLRIFDISDSGDRIAIEAPQGRLTVYDFRTKSKVFDGLDLYAGLPEREGPIAFGFGDPGGNLVAAVDKFGAIDVWDVKAKQRVVTGSPEPGKSPVAVGPRKRNGEYGLMAGKGWLKSMKWETGKFEQKIKVPALTGVPTAMAGQVEGGNVLHTAFLQVPEGGGDREVLIVDKLATEVPGVTAAAVWRVPLPAAAGVPKTLRWIEADKIVALSFEAGDSLLLLDFQDKTPVVYLKAGQEKTKLSETGAYAVMPNPKVPGKAAVLRTVIPGDAFARMLDVAKVNKIPPRVFVKPEGLSR